MFGSLKAGNRGMKSAENLFLGINYPKLKTVKYVVALMFYMNECTRALRFNVFDYLEPCVCHIGGNSVLNLVLYFIAASSQSEAIVKLL